MNLESLRGLGDLPFLCPSESYGSTTGYQSICVSTVVEVKEFCQVIELQGQAHLDHIYHVAYTMFNFSSYVSS